MIKYLYQVITGRRSGIIPDLIRLTLLPLSWLYLLIVKARNFFYERGIFKSKKLPCSVISIGNIVAGGTGKTPAAITIAKKLKGYGMRVAVISRGYGSKTRKEYDYVSDGEKLLLSPEEAGDEAHLLARSLPGVFVVIGKNRFLVGLEVVKRRQIDVIVLDDGFQHRKLARDLDIVTVDASQPLDFNPFFFFSKKGKNYGTNMLLPSGTLREPKSSLKRADLILLTRVDQSDDVESIRAQLKKYAPGVPIVESIHAPRSLRQIGSQSFLDLSFLANKNVLAVCGIAHPEAFLKTLQSLNVKSTTLLDFFDHNDYVREDFKLISQAALKADLVVTTEKDEQKLLALSEMPVFVLSVRLKLLTGKELLEKLIKEIV